jgi:hypothetical protein
MHERAEHTGMPWVAPKHSNLKDAGDDPAIYAAVDESITKGMAWFEKKGSADRPELFSARLFRIFHVCLTRRG